MAHQTSPLKIGAFISLRHPAYLEGLITQTAFIGGNTMMFFAGSPQNWKVLDWKNLDRQSFWNGLTKRHWNLADVCIHAHYLINLGNLINPQVYRKSYQLLEQICAFAQGLQIRYIILHPGSALKQDRTRSLHQVGTSLNQILQKYPQVTICLETMSGKGSELGKTFAELKTIIDQITNPEQIMICWDTCHLYAAGYDIKQKLPQVVAEFDQVIGLDKLKFIHVNDTLHPFNSHLDRHANLGAGYLGWKTFFDLVDHPQLKTKVLILETPMRNDLTVYQKEIQRLKEHAS